MRYTLVAAAITFAPITLDGADAGLFLSIGIAIVSTILLTFVTVRKADLRIARLVLSLAVYALLAFAVFRDYYGLHVSAKWPSHSNEARSELAAQATPKDGDLRHLDWDGYGFAGLETDTFLVSDPADNLAAFSGIDRVGSVPGIPCKVDRVQKLTTHYYAVTFYTDTSWDECDY